MLVAIGLTVMIGAPLMAIGGIIMALRQDVPLTISLAVILPVMVVVLGLILVRALPLFRSMQVKLDRINQIMRETLTGVRVIRAFSRGDHEERRFDEANRDLTGVGLRPRLLHHVSRPMVILNLSTVAILHLRRGGAAPVARAPCPSAT